MWKKKADASQDEAMNEDRGLEWVLRDSNIVTMDASFNIQKVDQSKGSLCLVYNSSHSIGCPLDSKQTLTASK